MHIPVVTVLVLGLAHGATYALLALGISLVYKASRVVNFAQGEIATLAAFIGWQVIVRGGAAWWQGALAALAVASAVGYLTHLLVAWPMRQAARVSVMMATLGVTFLLFGFEAKQWGASPEILPPPAQNFHFSIPLVGTVNSPGISLGGFLLTPVYVTALAAAMLAAALLTLVLRRTRFGLGVLATAQDPDTSRLLGVPARRVSAFTWTVAGLLAGMAGLLLAPTQGVFTAFAFSGYIFFRALVAALIGGLGSLSGAVLGALVVGELEAFSQQLFIRTPGMPEVFLFVLVLAVMLARPQGLFSRRALA